MDRELYAFVEVKFEIQLTRFNLITAFFGLVISHFSREARA